MRFLVLLASILAAGSAMANTPATAALNKLTGSGTFEGYNEEGKCKVSIAVNSNTVTIAVSEVEGSDEITLLNTATNYSVNETTLEMRANWKLNFPRYVNGGTKILNVRPAENEVAVAISTLLVDHNDNDESKFLECKISRR